MLKENELILITIEQVADIEDWKEFLLELTEYMMVVSVNEEKLVSDDDFLNNEGTYTIQINCDVEQYKNILLPYLIENANVDMVAVWRTVDELEDLLFEDDEE